MSVDTNGDSSLFVRGSHGSIELGAGGQAQVSVTAGSTAVANTLVCKQDIVAVAGGMQKNYEYISIRTQANSTPLMSATMMQISGGASNGFQFNWTKTPVRNTGSVVGLCLVSEDGIVTSGSFGSPVGGVPLTATILLNGNPLIGTDGSLCKIAVASGSSMNVVTFPQYMYAFPGASYLQVQLTASAGFATTVPTSASWLIFMDVEY
jgi:hypothetical protein